MKGATRVASRIIFTLLGTGLLGYVGLYYCGYDAVRELIAHFDCDWECAETSSSVWAFFRVFVLLETMLVIGIYFIALGWFKR
jgi:hypothetical protein